MLHEAAANIVGLNTGRRGEWPHQVQDAVDSLVHSAVSERHDGPDGKHSFRLVKVYDCCKDRRGKLLLTLLHDEPALVAIWCGGWEPLVQQQLPTLVCSGRQVNANAESR